MNSLTINIAILFHEADRRYLEQLEAHLTFLTRSGVNLWHRDRIPPGLDEVIVFRECLARAHIILLLVSADFVASFDTRVGNMLSELEPNERRIVPVSLRPCNWSGLPFFGLKPIPSDGAPIAQHSSGEQRYQEAAAEVATVVDVLRTNPKKPVEAITVKNPWLIAALADTERERHTLQKRLSELNAAMKASANGMPVFGLDASNTEYDDHINAVLSGAILRLQHSLGESHGTSKEAILLTLWKAAEQIERGHASAGSLLPSQARSSTVSPSPPTEGGALKVLRWTMYTTWSIIGIFIVVAIVIGILRESNK